MSFGASGSRTPAHSPRSAACSGSLSSRTMMVMMMAITPSLKASMRPVPGSSEVSVMVGQAFSSHRLRSARNGDDAGARHFDEAKRQHQADELVDLVGFPRELEHEALGGGVDDARAEGVGEPQRLAPALAGALDLDHSE